MNANVEMGLLNDRVARGFLTDVMDVSGTADNIRLLQLIVQDYQREQSCEEIDLNGPAFTRYLQTHDFYGLFGRY
ncbi:hypothetical protein D6445_11275 [Salmonella enterica subsp. enterica serovar Infantis]|nr:hypothetical protein [Salmonella enterica subsp. enterica serovar Infantis]EGI5923716.1 hypothetical protein [Salmonella enterica subsp. enterica serovar Colindale]